MADMSAEESKRILEMKALRAELKALCLSQAESPMVAALKRSHDSIKRFESVLKNPEISEPAPTCPCLATLAAFRRWRRQAMSWLKGGACRG